MPTVRDAFCRLSFALLTFMYSCHLHAAPKVEEWQDESGARVVYVEDHTNPILDVRVDFSAGSSLDPRAKAGLAQLTVGLLSAGSGPHCGHRDSSVAARSEGDLSRQLSAVAAIYNAEADVDTATVSLRTLSESSTLKEALGAFHDILQAPCFPESAVRSEVVRVSNDLVEAKSFPPALARAALKREVFPADPYGYVATPETVGHITRIDMERFYGTYYDASDTVVTLVGDINRAGASAIAHQLTADLPVGRRPLTALPHAAAGESTSKGSYKAAASWSNVQHIVLPGDEAYVLMGQPGVAIDDPDYFPLLVGNYILGGGGFRSWLTRELRERRGLTYGVISEFLTQRKGGMFVIMFETRPDEAAESIRIARSTVVDIVNRGPTDAEIEQAKANLIGNFSTRVSSNEQLLANAALIGVYDLPLDWMDRWTDRVNAVSASAVRQALRARLSTQKMVTIEVGPKN